MPAALANSVRNKLVLLFFTITAAAVGFVYLYVVPQLSSSLTAGRLERLERAAEAEAGPLERAERLGYGESELGRLLRRVAASADARVTLLGVRGSVPRFVIADSQGDAEASLGDYPSAARAARTGRISSGVSARSGEEIGEAALPVPAEVDPPWVAVLSTPLGEVADNVDLIQRQILIAGGIALAASLLLAWFAAGAHARRLRRLEAAAEEVAGGSFRVPIPVGPRDEVGQLAEALDSMQKRLDGLDSARREFIANASHELRTPVASLGGFLELLEDEEEPDEETRREFVRTMRGQIDRLNKLTTDLLDLSRLDSDAIELSSGPVDLAAVAAEVAGEFGAVAKLDGSRIEVRSSDGSKPLARADRGRTMQIMRILIDNAIKHTPAGTRITIEAQITADGAAAVAVTDDGPGIDAGRRDRVFERFHTGDSASGTGLGLAISRELAWLMGGDLTLATRRGRTTFTLTLPPAARPAVR
jgi:signal transduction histidine kinase